MTAKRTPVWKSIHASLTSDIAEGRYAPGDKLPTEAALARRFGVNRHTVRRALGAMVDENLIHTRRGAGAFIAQRPTEYPIGRRVRFHRNLRAAGRLPAKEILSLETRQADTREAEALQLAARAHVHVCEGLSLADGQPIALFRSVFPADCLPGLLDSLRCMSSITDALAAQGVADYTRVWTRVTAKLASATQALHLQLQEGAPLLRTVSLSIDPEKRPVEYGRTWFAGDRVTLSLTENQ